MADITGGRAIFNRLGALGPKRAGAQGAAARFRELERTGRGREYLEQAGVTATSRTQMKWLSGEATPNKANSDAIGAAYRAWQRDNLVNRATRGRRPIEVYPSTEVRQQSRDQISGQPVPVTLTDDEWKKLASAYQRNDIAAADKIWHEAVDREIIGSPPGRAYATVDHVWFGE